MLRIARGAGLSRLLEGDAENGQRCGVVVAFTVAVLRVVVEYGRRLMLGGGNGGDDDEMMLNVLRCHLTY